MDMDAELSVKPLRSLAYGEVRLRLGLAALDEKRSLDAARWVKLAASNDHPEGLKVRPSRLKCWLPPPMTPLMII